MSPNIVGISYFTKTKNFDIMRYLKRFVLMDIDGKALEYIEMRNKTYFLILVIITIILTALVAKDSYVVNESSKLDVYYKMQLNAFTVYTALFLALLKSYPKFYMINFMVVYVTVTVICITGTYFSLFSMEYGMFFYSVIYIGISMLLSIANYKVKDYERKVCDILYGKKNKYEFL